MRWCWRAIRCAVCPTNLRKLDKWGQKKKYVTSDSSMNWVIYKRKLRKVCESVLWCVLGWVSTEPVRATETRSWLGVLSATVGSHDLQKQRETPPQGRQSRPKNTERNTHTVGSPESHSWRRLKEITGKLKRVQACGTRKAFQVGLNVVFGLGPEWECGWSCC